VLSYQPPGGGGRKFSARERWIGIIAGIVIGLAVFDQLLLSPLLARLDSATQRVDLAEAQLAKARATFSTRTKAERRWRDVAGKSLMSDASAAQSQLLNRVREWAQVANLKLSALTPERTDKESGFEKITIRATAEGGMSQVSRFLFYVQTGDIPVKMNEVTLASRKDGTDDLSLQVSISTIYEKPEAKKPGDAAKEAPR
jgi:multidrug efflux pump subunit AcrA (membrane-fusion protein)